MSARLPKRAQWSTAAATRHYGCRCASGSGPALGYASRSQGEINNYLNEQTLLIAMLETPEAIENADAIAAVDGIDMLHIGSSDLSAGMGIAGQ
jgi:2-keto-3-deoxy-L-rhamnonate aldolase RhmA